jgi:hypothetical protein
MDVGIKVSFECASVPVPLARERFTSSTLMPANPPGKSAGAAYSPPFHLHNASHLNSESDPAYKRNSINYHIEVVAAGTDTGKVADALEG